MNWGISLTRIKAMRRKGRARSLACVAAIMALATPQMAMAQKCINKADMADAAIYSVPLIVDAVQLKCGSRLDDDGFLARKGKQLKARYASLQDKTWPGAYRAISTYASQDKSLSEIWKMSEGMPPHAMRPVVDALGPQAVASRINKRDCKAIERGLELLAPLKPSHSSQIVSFILTMDTPKQLKICR